MNTITFNCDGVTLISDAIATMKKIYEFTKLPCSANFNGIDVIIHKDNCDVPADVLYKKFVEGMDEKRNAQLPIKKAIDDDIEEIKKEIATIENNIENLEKEADALKTNKDYLNNFIGRLKTLKLAGSC